MYDQNVEVFICMDCGLELDEFSVERDEYGRAVCPDCGSALTQH